MPLHLLLPGCFENCLNCWLLEGRWRLFYPYYCPMLFSNLFDLPVLSVLTGSPQLLVLCMAALQDVLTLIDVRGGLGWVNLP